LAMSPLHTEKFQTARTKGLFRKEKMKHLLEKKFYIEKMHACKGSKIGHACEAKDFRLR
jgi:hypothetical protein